MTRDTRFWGESEPLFDALIEGPFGTPYVRERCQVAQVPVQFQAPEWSAPRRTPDPAVRFREGWPTVPAEDVTVEDEAAPEDDEIVLVPVVADDPRTGLLAALTAHAADPHPTVLDMHRADTEGGASDE